MTTLHARPSHVAGAPIRLPSPSPATTYDTYHNVKNSMLHTASERKLNGTFRWHPSHWEPARPGPPVTGYKCNLLPCFPYDKAIDENDQFRYVLCLFPLFFGGDDDMR